MNIDIECLRFGYETDLLGTAETRLGAIFSQNQKYAEDLLNMRKRNLLGNAVRITSDLLSEVHKCYQSCLDIIGEDLYGDLFVCQNNEYNANVFAHNKKFDLLINSALINDFTLDELRFVLGHELGHVLFGHSHFSVKEILSLAEEKIDNSINPASINLLFRLSRVQELSADRIGLLCCGQLTSAVKALFQTASGLIGIDEDRILDSFRNQYNALENHIEKAVASKFWFYTHPMIPIRFKALELAALDIIAFRKQSKAFSAKGFASIDKKIAAILRSLDNSVCLTTIVI